MESITHLKYKNKECIVLENSRIRAEFLPKPGGKLASLISKEKGYELTNNSDFDFEFLWADHFMINIEEGGKLVVPEDCAQRVTILASDNCKLREINNWPENNKNKERCGNTFRSDICRPINSIGLEKYYFLNKWKNG